MKSMYSSNKSTPMYPSTCPRGPLVKNLVMIIKEASQGIFEPYSLPSNPFHDAAKKPVTSINTTSMLNIGRPYSSAAPSVHQHHQRDSLSPSSVKDCHKQRELRISMYLTAHNSPIHLSLQHIIYNTAPIAKFIVLPHSSNAGPLLRCVDLHGNSSNGEALLNSPVGLCHYKTYLELIDHYTCNSTQGKDITTCRCREVQSNQTNRFK